MPGTRGAKAKQSKGVGRTAPRSSPRAPQQLDSWMHTMVFVVMPLLLMGLDVMNPPHSPGSSEPVIREDFFGRALQRVWQQSALGRQILWLVVVVVPVVWVWEKRHLHAQPLRATTQEYVGVVVFMAGYSLRLWAKRALGSGFTYVISTPTSPALVTDGPYSMLVHPSYTGAVVSYGIGMLLTMRVPLVLTGALFVVGCAVLYTLRVVPEEAMLRQHFGSEAFDAFAATRFSLIPFVI